ncbi:MAG: hypothetical protein CVV59_01110 [Tenericutes bacterium HGW-Tenericutes-4]|nr:MAG: hypothetical protein CVV59_01110 [Tenericutes bacterium HGW-Tenericutes-4]
MKQNYYIFLDIDGVLWDEEFITQLIDDGIRERKDDDIANHFKPGSMQALNFLLDTLKQNYEVVLVVSSSKRSDMKKTIQQLKNNNLTCVTKIDRTSLSLDTPRGEEILDYLKNKQDNKNYCIIDDEIEDIKPYVNKERIIKTSDQNALHKQQVVKFLKKIEHLKQTSEVLEP